MRSASPSHMLSMTWSGTRSVAHTWGRWIVTTPSAGTSRNGRGKAVEE